MRMMRKIGAAIMAIVLMITIVPGADAEAATKRLNKKTLTLWEGDYYQLYVKYNKLKFEWTSADETVAAVDSDGYVTAVGEGVTTVTAARKDKVFTCEVTVKRPHFTEDNIVLLEGNRRQLTFTGPYVRSYTSSDNDVLTVDSKGRVTALQPAENVYVTAKCGNGMEYRCNITVEERIISFNTPNEDEWGILYTHPKQYEWIPEKTYDHPSRADMRDILKDAMYHGTDKLVFTNMEDEVWSEFYIGNIDDYYKDMAGDYAENIYNLYYDTRTNEAMHKSTWTLLIPYGLGTKIMFSMTIKNYDLEKSINTAKELINGASPSEINFCSGEHIGGDISYTYADATRVMTAAKKVILEMSTDSSLNTDRKILEYLHHYLCDTMTYYHYDDTRDVQRLYPQYSNAIGAFLLGEGCCRSYTDAMQIFLTYLGYQNIRQCGWNHVWNRVYIDGEYINIDVTWDDSACTDYFEGKRVYSEYITLDESNHNVRWFYLTDDKFEDHHTCPTTYFYMR